MVSIPLVLIIIAFALFLAAGVGASVPRVNLVALGLAFWTLSLFVERL